MAHGTGLHNNTMTLNILHNTHKNAGVPSYELTIKQMRFNVDAQCRAPETQQLPSSQRLSSSHQLSDSQHLSGSQQPSCSEQLWGFHQSPDSQQAPDPQQPPASHQLSNSQQPPAPTPPPRRVNPQLPPKPHFFEKPWLTILWPISCTKPPLREGGVWGPHRFQPGCTKRIAGGSPDTTDFEHASYEQLKIQLANCQCSEFIQIY